MREIIFFIPDLNGGGAERALFNLLNYWPSDLRTQWLPVLAVRRLAGPLLDEVPDWIEILSLGLPRSGLWSSIGTVVRLAALLRKRRPKIVITFLSSPSVVLASKIAATNSRIVISVQNPPLSVRADPTVRGLARTGLATYLSTWAYKHADLILPITPGIAHELIAHIGVPSSHLAILPNSVDLNKINDLKSISVDHPAFQDPDTPIIITACRHVYQKGVDILLKAASRLYKKLKFYLIILGEGIERRQLEQLALKLGIDKQVFFLGFQQNPWRFISKASVFVLASRYEGFGNVLIEAMACGTPVVTTVAPFGPEYLITDKDCGLLVPVDDPLALAHAIEQVLTDEALSTRLRIGGLQRAVDFDVKRVFDTFWSLMQSLDMDCVPLRPKVTSTSK